MGERINGDRLFLAREWNNKEMEAISFHCPYFIDPVVTTRIIFWREKEENFSPAFSSIWGRKKKIFV